MNDNADPDPAPCAKAPSSRRTLLAGAGAAGAALVAARLMPAALPAEPVVAAAVPKASPDTSGGYRLSEHVKRYYETTRA